MRYAAFASVIALALASVAHAQTKPPSGAPPSTTAPSAAEAKFKAADKDSSGALEGTEADAYKANMAKIDANKDGKVTREEFLAAAKAGIIK